MFTGIVESVGEITARQRDRLEIRPRRPWEKVKIGESICVDGACLTVEKIQGSRLSFRLLAETARATTLGEKRAGERVNLERSLQVGRRLGGHLLLGHVDGRGKIRAKSAAQESVSLEIQVPASISSLLVPKGPIALDGVSLTLDIPVPGARGVPGTGLKDRIRVHLVSHTLRSTTLGGKEVGSVVNLEVDLVAKYLRAML